VIVMLVNNQKNDTVPTYWPTKPNGRISVGNFYVLKLKNSSSSTSQTTSILSLKSLARGERRTIYHLYFTDFTQEGVPSSVETFVSFIDAVSSVKRHVENELRELNRSSTISAEQSPSTNNGHRAERSRSIGRPNGLMDMTNRLRAVSTSSHQSLIEQTAIWRKKLSFSSSNTSSSSASQNVPSQASINGRPKTAVFYALSRTPSNQTDSPLTIVHCADGARESGVYVLVEVLIRCIENNMNVEIAQVLRQLRHQRMCLINNASQYRFIHLLVVDFLKKSRLI